jgi:hypothetical protein
MCTRWEFQIDGCLVVFEVDYFTRIVTLSYTGAQSDGPGLIERFSYGNCACGTFVWDSQGKKFHVDGKKASGTVRSVVERVLLRTK